MTALWLPILVSAVFVFIASSIMHTVLTYHKSDCHQLPDEDKLLAALRGAGLQRGLYMFPYCDPKDMKSPAMQEKYKQGPIGMMTVFPPGPPVLPKFLAMWFAYCLMISVFVAYIAAHSTSHYSTFLVIFRNAGFAALLAYGVANLSNGIWKGQPWSMTIKEAVDGVVYAAVTGAAFAWLWPRA
ncbi:MAG TPA: hypothetical protein VFI38_14435 [Candidatus Acidoferrum sp.]|nr:hypothetical protein [Candidatus Acidoferrum sp.]